MPDAKLASTPIKMCAAVDGRAGLCGLHWESGDKSQQEQRKRSHANCGLLLDLRRNRVEGLINAKPPESLGIISISRSSIFLFFLHGVFAFSVVCCGCSALLFLRRVLFAL